MVYAHQKVDTVDSQNNIDDLSETIDKKTFLETVLRLEQKIDSLKETTARQEWDKTEIKSFRDFKQELKAIASPDGHSKVLGTSSCFKKLFMVLIYIPLIASCLYFIVATVIEYAEYNVVTEIKVKEEEAMTFPAVTFCLVKFNIMTEQITSRSLKDAFISCRFMGRGSCRFEEFSNFQLTSGNLDPIGYDCYQFNGENSLRSDLYKTSQFGANTGLTLTLNVSQSEFVYFFVGDNGVQPVFKEMINIAQTGKFIWVDIEKRVDIKLPAPYSDCTLPITPATSSLVSKVLQQGITYRKVNCYELCRLEHLQFVRGQRNVSDNNATYPFTYEANCFHLCPLECSTKTFDVNVNYVPVAGLAQTNLIINIFYPNSKYTELIQTVKTSESDMMSGLGGTLGLFLEFSFLSVYRHFISFFDLFH